MRLTEEQIKNVCEYLEGSCRTMTQALLAIGSDIEEHELDEEDWNQIEAQIMLCEDCLWWSEAYEVTDGICNECGSSHSGE